MTRDKGLALLPCFFLFLTLLGSQAFIGGGSKARWGSTNDKWRDRARHPGWRFPLDDSFSSGQVPQPEKTLQSRGVTTASVLYHRDTEGL